METQMIALPPCQNSSLLPRAILHVVMPRGHEGHFLWKKPFFKICLLSKPWNLHLFHLMTANSLENMCINIVKYHKNKSVKIMLLAFLTIFPFYVTSFVLFLVGISSLWLSSNNPVHQWKCTPMFTICSCFLNEGVLSKARQIITVINQVVLAFEEWTA